MQRSVNNKNRSHGKINKLPEQLRKQVEAKLLEGFTYEQISDFLTTMGHSIHFSSVQRFGKPFLQKFEQVRMAKEYAQLLAEDNADRPSTELNEANNALASQLLMEMLVDANMPAEERVKTIKSISLLQQAQVQNERLKIISRKEAGAVRSAMNMFKKRVFDELQTNHPAIVELLIKIADEETDEAQTQ